MEQRVPALSALVTTGVVYAMLETPGEAVERDTSADMIDSTVVRAHHCAVTRYDKTAEACLGFVALASVERWLRCVHDA